MEETGDGDDHPAKLHNESPQIVSDIFTTVTEVLQQYGWFFILAVLVLFYVKFKMRPTINRMKKRAEEIKDKKIDPDMAQSRLEAMERARQKLQEEHQAKAALYMERQQIKEEEKRKSKIEEWENLQEGRGYHSKTKPREESSESSRGATGFKAKPKLRDPDYNPLMGGGGGGTSFRPARRGGGGGGGG